MRSTFYGLEIARTGLYISQKALDVTGHNISNVDTAGYTRQRLSLSSIDPYSASFQMKPLAKGLVGGGTQVQVLEQIRNEYLDRQFRNEQSQYSYWATRSTGMGYLESIYDNINVGFSDAINSLFNAFDDLVHSSSDQEQRTVTQQAALTLMASMQSAYNSMVTQHAVQNESVKGVADSINDILDSIVMLNDTINRFETHGTQKANDLRDKRNLLLDQLSALIDINYYENEKGQLMVEAASVKDLVNNEPIKLINHLESNKIEYTQVTNNITGDPDLWELTLDDVVLNFNNVGGGELKGHLELRDNFDQNNPGIPYLIEQLNNLARALAMEINDIHRTGFTSPNSGNPSTDGIDFFWVPLVDEMDPSLGYDYSKLNAGNMRLSDEVTASVWNIACSSEPIDLADPENAKAGNQEIALKLSQLIDSTALPNATTTGINSFNSYILSMVAEYASTTHHSSSQADTLYYNLASIDNNRLSISGVSLDEEMTNLIRYQHAYNGAARVITTMDEALEMLITRMGRVGL